ncbi:glycine betaine ABC transporter substrate-binding protein [Dongia sedimenti]|uniref:Glycine betaine ABC transporter substrate-binding protein n=1 Tax=Dongia sedimenti TaxID=3064282 RepID=A0ABU0YJH3_9PROT|nr:glycine betaine ABC transporter substrate-binding protein [Rhodospirillaceae bacterium R-7]
MKLRALLVATAAISALSASAAFAAEPESCKEPHFADVGWTDNTAQNGLLKNVLDGLGYKAKIDNLALPLILEALKAKQLDFFLDNWMPSNAANVQPYLDEKSIDSLEPNLMGAGYGPVVPDYVAAAGVKDIKDLGANKDKFDGKFYGIEPGNDGNKIIQAKIDDANSGMAGFELVESSEQGMLSQAEKAIAAQEWVAFLGWAPHPVMGRMKLVYLTGFEKDGFGDAKINALTRPGYVADCPNMGKLLTNLKFDLAQESAVMDDITKGEEGQAAAAKWLKANPGVLDAWLAGVTTVDGGDGLAAVKKSLGL